MDIHGHILIIDDEAALRQTLARILQRTGCEVTTAASGEEGLAYLAQGSFDLVYLDIRMPGMNGLASLKAIHASHPDLPVVLFTAQPDLSSAVEALREGASDYLLKPLHPKTLVDRTQTILARRDKELRKRKVQAQIDALQDELKRLESETDIPPAARSTTMEAGDRYLKRGQWTLDMHTHRLTIDQRVVDLPPTAFDYLLVLVRHAPRVVDYQTLVAEAQGYQAEVRAAQEIVKWHVHHIRQAIEPEPGRPSLLINVRGTGYRLVLD
jgi:two-component system response regulator MtrA